MKILNAPKSQQYEVLVSCEKSLKVLSLSDLDVPMIPNAPCRVIRRRSYGAWEPYTRHQCKGSELVTVYWPEV